MNEQEQEQESGLKPVNGTDWAKLAKRIEETRESGDFDDVELDSQEIKTPRLVVKQRTTTQYGEDAPLGAIINTVNGEVLTDPNGDIASPAIEFVPLSFKKERIWFEDNELVAYSPNDKTVIVSNPNDPRWDGCEFNEDGTLPKSEVSHYCSWTGEGESREPPRFPKVFSFIGYTRKNPDQLVALNFSRTSINQGKNLASHVKSSMATQFGDFVIEVRTKEKQESGYKWFIPTWKLAGPVEGDERKFAMQAKEYLNKVKVDTGIREDSEQFEEVDASQAAEEPTNLDEEEQGQKGPQIG